MYDDTSPHSVSGPPDLHGSTTLRLRLTGPLLFALQATLPRVEAALQMQYNSKPRAVYVEDLQYQVDGWVSNSGEFLQLPKLDVVQFSRGTTVNIPVLFTAPPGSRLELFYQVWRSQPADWSCSIRHGAHSRPTGAVLSGMALTAGRLELFYQVWRSQPADWSCSIRYGAHSRPTGAVLSGMALTAGRLELFYQVWCSQSADWSCSI